MSHFFHKWSKWAATPATIYRRGKAFKVTLQYRTCKTCGFSQSKEI